LWDSTEWFVQLPVFHRACVKELFDEIEKSSILDVLSECRDDEIMVE
jgi:hypothetical protein